MDRKQTAKNEDTHTLVKKIKEGDREAFQATIRLYQKKVFLLAFSFLRNREDAMDIVQETFMRLYQKIDTFQRGKNFQNWLLQIAKNLCIDYYRKSYSKRKEFESENSIEELNLSLDPEHDSFATSDLKEIFSHSIQKLAERQRMIVTMKHYNDLKYDEIAQILNISLGTVKSLHFKAIQNLRRLMSPYLGIEE
jgi:RNA polymerase sigma-70 factor (ECF subfamily)